jgi:hypothetical protein
MSSLFSYLDNLYYGSFMGHYFFSGFALEVIIRQAKLLKYKILSFLTFGGPRGRYKERKRKYREKFRKL